MTGHNPYAAEPHFWIGRLSRSITLALVDLRDDRPRAAREHLTETVREFMRSPVPSEEPEDRSQRGSEASVAAVRRGGFGRPSRSFALKMRWRTL